MVGVPNENPPPVALFAAGVPKLNPPPVWFVLVWVDIPKRPELCGADACGWAGLGVPNEKPPPAAAGVEVAIPKPVVGAGAAVGLAAPKLNPVLAVWPKLNPPLIVLTPRFQ